MKLTTNRTEFYNDICESIRLFYPDEEIELCECGDLSVTVTGCFTAVAQLGDKTASCELVPCDNTSLELKRTAKRCAKLAVYKLFCAVSGKELPWGSLTGIRPTKLYYENGANDGAEHLMCDILGVSQQKMGLLKRISAQQTQYISFPQGYVDIYVGIPFCRTRCIYCSFATHDATKHKLILPYMKALLHEIDFTVNFLRQSGLKVRCLYIGGGTPTALPDEQFNILTQACAAFDPQLEFTVEAGRPDTINRYKLECIKHVGAERISINPQTMNDGTLRLIGRQHTSQDIEACFDLAREVGFKVINADLIAGLPSEGVPELERTLEQLLPLKAENVTVHTLSLKRGSVITENPDKYPMPDEQTVALMVDKACCVLTDWGYEPYYMYRQKYQAGNLENVGYCKPGCQGVYNIDIMEETGSIIALGAGAISKRVISAENRIERTANSKSIYDYIERIEEMELRKERLFTSK